MSDRYWAIAKYDANEEELREVKIRLLTEVFSKVNCDCSSLKIDFEINWDYGDYYEMLCTVTVNESDRQ